MITGYRQRGPDCAICGRAAEAVLELRGLPLTGRFSTKPSASQSPGIDQQLWFCVRCNHAQLGVIVDPAELYDATYSFRTSLSEHARAGSGFFLQCLQELTGGARFHCVVDIGCNDLYLLRELEGKADFRVGVDPIWKGREHEVTDDRMTVIGTGIENAALASRLPETPDLIVLRHTIEHLENPMQVLSRVAEIAGAGCLIAMESPGLETLLAHARFDQIFHQHLQYFSLGSFNELALRNGFRLSGWRVNYHSWGAIFVLMTKRGDEISRLEIPKTNPGSASYLRDSFDVFKEQLHASRTIFESLEADNAYGYGAAQTLPVLFYHMGFDPASLDAVLDDDPTKDGIHYWNLPVQVRRPRDGVRLDQAKILITALDHTRAIVQKLLSQNPPKDIVIPAVTI